MSKLKKWLLAHLDFLATIFGAVIGLSQLLVATEHITQKDGLLIGGIASIALGVVTNKKSPANRHNDLSHLGVSTSNHIDSAFAEMVEQQAPQRSPRRNRRNQVEEQNLSAETSDVANPADERHNLGSMGDRANPLNRKSPRELDDNRGL